VCVTPERGIRSMKELIARVRSESRQVVLRLPGNGTSQHLAGASEPPRRHRHAARAFKGGAPSLQAVLRATCR